MTAITSALTGIPVDVRPAAGPLEPLKALAREPGARKILAVAMIYAVTSALGKRGVMLVGPAVRRRPRP